MNYYSKRNKWLVGLALLVIPLIILLNLSKPVYTQTKLESRKSDTIHKYIAEMVIEEEVPGMIAAIISSDSIIDIGSAGVRKVGSTVALTSNDIVYLGSCTKAMTSTMIATLVADGKLSWDMKLTEVIPEYKKNIHPDYQNTTLWQLLTHRAGLPRGPKDWEAYSQKEIKVRRMAILKENLIFPATFNIGEFHYSNFGYMIVACMAEKITGLSWETLMRQRLFEPLGMTTAGFGDPSKHKSIDQPWGHKKFGWIWRPSKSYYTETFGPAGEVHCSIEDWAKFLSLQLNGKNTFLDSIFLNKLIEPIGSYAGGWGVVEQAWANGIVLFHNGSNEIWFTTVMVAPKLDRAFVVVTNSCDFSNFGVTCNKMLSKLIKMNSNRSKNSSP